MHPPFDRHRQLRAVFDQLLGVDPSARGSELDRLCAGDAALRADVVRLLSAHENADSFLEHPLEWHPAVGDGDRFAGTERFRVIRRLGSGGMGVVYEVHDERRAEVVALKTLRRNGAADLYRLKQEFRRLAGVTHPNLVCLYELFVEEEACFFTMELVRGASFTDHVRGSDHGLLSRERLFPALHQLIDGVSALHHRGTLHRDLKPSNVLVTPEGRVVILDFGLSSGEFFQRAMPSPAARGGTPAYMSPEEVAGAPPTEASDWYSVGATLYEALTGLVPFDGPVAEVLERKRVADPPAPSAISQDPLAAELSDLCLGLLCRDPAQRLSGSAVRARLMREPPESAPAASVQETPFVGRRTELQTLDHCWSQVRSGHAKAVSICGPSGIGKSALVRAFLNRFESRADVVILAGRCYENESVPYKALDGVVDDLSRYLAAIEASRVERLLPPEISALARVFPVFRQVKTVARVARELEIDRVDPLQLRRRAFEALSELLRRLALESPLAVWIDDLQWADTDSMVLLEDLLSAANAPPMFTILGFRSEEITAKPFLRALLERDDPGKWTRLELEPMPNDEATELIADLLPRNSALSTADRLAMTREAGGSPFVLEQLARHAGLANADSASSPTFTAMLESQLRGLSGEARRFLETLAICGRPVAPEIVCDACAIARDRQSLVVMLRASHLIRSSGSSERVETYHDRIREGLASRVDPGEVRDIHRRMATSLVARHNDDCEALFEHYRGAGDDENASIQAGLAAEKANMALAFDRAASFYSFALALAPASASARASREGLATALANAGRPAEAAEAYLRAADGADHARRVELQRRAAEHFLTGGHIDRGLDLMRQVLESLGLNYAISPRRAAVRLLWRRLRLQWRGLEFEPRRPEEVDSLQRLRLDACWSATTGLSHVDPVSASAFVAQQLHMALDTGDVARISRGMAMESAARSVDWMFRKSAARFADRARSLAEQVGTAQALAIDLLADGTSATASGQWARARRSSEQALAILRERCVGMTWEMNIAHNTFIWALMYLGEIREVCGVVPALLADARRRGNRYLATELCTRCNYAWLAVDDPDEGEREVAAAMAGWSQKAFHRQHYSAMIARVQTALYRGDGEQAWQHLLEQESRLARSMLLHIQAIRIETLYLRARSAVAIAAASASKRRRFLSIARGYVDRIAREQMPWSDPLARLAGSAIASLEGQHDNAVNGLHEAADLFDRADMKLYLAVTRRRIGQLRRDDTGRQHLRDGDEWMSGQGIKNPAALTRTLAPGFPEA